MTKRLLNLQTITKITLILTTLILLPQTAWAEESYVITVGGNSPNEDGIITGTNITKGTVTYDADNYTLTLKEAIINMSDGGYAIESNIDNLIVYFEGQSEIICAGSAIDKGAFKYTGSNNQPKVTFSTNTSGYNDFGSLIVDNIYSMSQFFSGYTAGNEWIDSSGTTEEEDGWYNTATENSSNVDPKVKVKYRRYYDLWFGYNSDDGVSYYRLHSDREGDYFTFDAAESVLSYNYNDSHYVFKSSLPKLTVEVNEGGTLSQIVFNSKDGVSTGELAFSVSPGAELTLANSNGVILGFDNVTFENGTILKSPSPSPSAWNATITSATLTGPQSYDIWIDNTPISEVNANDVLGDGKVSYDEQSNTLTLDGAELTSPIFVGKESLTIDLKGANSIFINEERESSAIRAEACSLTILSSTETGILALSCSNGYSLTQGITATITKPLVSSADITNEQVTKATIHPVYPPFFSNTSKTETGISVYIDNDEGNGGAGTIKYSIEYADKSTGITNQTFAPETGISMTKPGTLTAWVELDSENKSTDLIGKFFGYKQNSIRNVFNGTDAVTFTPEIIPEIEEGDNTVVSYQSEGIATVTDNIISMSSFGSSMVSARFEIEDQNALSTRLNPDTIQVRVMAVPAAPSIPEDNSTFLNTDKIAITSTAPSGTTICYKWDDGEEKTYSDEIAIEGTTLSAWVKYQAYTGAEVVYSDTITATYTIKTDIAEYYVVPIENITYTGSAVTPTIIVKEANNSDAATLVEGTDYEISYKKGETAITADQLINVDTYTAVITGKGNYAGTINESFQITKASADWTSDAWTVPVAKEDMKYTGEAMDLITAGSAPEGATIKYLTVANPESYDYSESANEEWTTTVPQGTAVGDYAIFYKVEGGDNYENWGPSEVGIKASIDMGEVSISAEDQTSTYTGEEIAFDKNNIEISVSTISKDAIGLKYYAPNSENPEEPTLLDNAPINAGTYTVEIYLEDDNYTAESINVTLTITKANITPTVSIEGWTYGGTANAPSVTGNTGNGDVTYTYKAAGAETFTSEVPTAVGTHTIKATIAETANYNEAEATAEFTITAATMTVTAEGYSGIYDAKAHGITVSAPDGATVKYGTQKGTYDLDASPTYTDAGTYKVHYQVTKDNYTAVTDSATVEITKAEAGLAFSVSEDEKVYATIGESFTEPVLTNPYSLNISYESSDESIATVDAEGKVTLKTAGLTYISAIFAGDNNCEADTVRYQLRVKGKYNLWIDNIQVTSENYSDILNDGKNCFFYDLVRKWLIITSNEVPVEIKSEMPELTIYLNGDSKLDRIYFDNQGNAENTGTLTITTYTNIPGSLVLDTNHADGVISGFSTFTIDESTSLCIQEPEGGVYEGGKLLKASGGEVAKEAAIGQYIEPMTKGETVNVGQGMDSTTDITNTVVDGTILITGVQHVDDTDENDDYAEGGAIVLNNTNTTENVEQVSQSVENGTITPGTDDYAQNFQGGLTFLVPSGEGVIELEVQTEAGYMLMLKIGTSEPHEIIEDERAIVKINYDVAEPTYVYVYLQEKVAASRNSIGNTRVGKRDKAHGRIYSVNVSPSKVAANNPLNDVEGVEENRVSIPEVATVNKNDDTPTKIDADPVIIVTEATTDGKWYTIDGRRIDKPTQKGLYIKDGKKIVIK